MTINNATVSQNTKDILPLLLRMYDRRKLNTIDDADCVVAWKF